LERLRIFVSSPGDVGPERAVAAAVIERLQLEFRGRILLETYLWERSLLLATETFQSQILDIREADLAVFILWSRIGFALPEQFRRDDGSRYESGTEYEFEHALAGYERQGRPEIVFYLKTADVQLSVRDRERREQQTADLDAVNRFVERRFRNPDGTFKSAYREFDNVSAFEEQFEHHLREWIRRRVKDVEPSGDRQWRGSPFRGLQPFDYEHALIYCGRTGLITEVIDALRERAAAGRALLMIIGMSGAGKSSLVRAGVLPMLSRPRVVERVIDWRRAVFRPSDSQRGVWASLGAALTAEHALPDLVGDEAALAPLLRQPHALIAAISRALDRIAERARALAVPGAGSGGARLVLVVDQFEEIFDETLTADERGEFAALLAALSQSGLVWVLITLRADLYARCAELPQTFRDLLAERGGVLTVVAPRPAELAQMIRQPAAMAGLSFERRGDPEEGLDDVLRDAAVEHPSVLPLLEFTLDELWKCSEPSGLLRFGDYENIGGLHGALRQRADAEFALLPESARDALPQFLSAIVRIDPTDERLIVESRVPRAQFGDGTPCQTLLTAFIAAHLLVADRAPDGTPVVGLAHEALLREWPPAVEWVERNRERLRLRAGIAAAAALWRDSGQHDDRLLSGTFLKDASGLVAAAPTMLGPNERRFVAASLERARRLRRRHIGRGCAAALAVAVAVLLPAIGLDTLGYAVAVGHGLSSVWSSAAPIPVSDRVRDNLKGDLGSLSAYLQKRVGDMGLRPEFNAWAVAQTWAALYGLDASLPPRAARLRRFMTERRDPDCFCWRETDDKLPHTVATAWVLYALALYGQPAEPQELAALLDRQGAAGWWSMFPATPDPGNASTAATAWASLALHAQLSRNLVPAGERERTGAAIRKAAAWLRSRAEPGRARWSEYAPDHTAERGDYLAVSGLAVYALRAVAGDAEFDRRWLAELPRRVPGLNENETAKGQVFRSKHQFTLDDVRHYRFPWMLQTTVDAFPHGSDLEKARALVWLDKALGRPLTGADFHNEVWTIAETLFVFRQVAPPLLATRP